MGLTMSVVSADTISKQAQFLFVHKQVGQGAVLAKDKRSDQRDVVIIPVDETAQAMHAFNWYVDNMHQKGNKLYILHCWEIERPDGHNFPDYAIAPEAWNDIFHQSKERGSEILKMYEEKLKEKKLEGTLRTVFGRPGHTIVEAATEYHANQIVVGTRSLGPMGRSLLGSISNYVLHHSNVPVTIVPSPNTKSPIL